MKKKGRVLIISYYWPPSGGSGVQRWLKFAKYLPSNGWETVVFTPENPDFDIADISLEKDIPGAVNIIKHRIIEPYSVLNFFGKGKANAGVGSGPKAKKNKTLFSRIMLWIRGNVFIPDPRILWVRPATKVIFNYLQENPVDVVVSTGPPHSMHLIAKKVKNRFDIPWIADFRDPLSAMDVYDEYLMTQRSRKKLMQVEQEILNECDIVLSVTPSLDEMLLSFDKSKLRVITNGYDETDFQQSTVNKESKTFRLLHAGTLGAVRNPIGLWDALESLSNERRDLLELLKIDFVGNVSPEIIDLVKSSSNLNRMVSFLGYMSRAELGKHYTNTDALLLAIHSSAVGKVSIPGKVFEYMASGKPILGLGAVNSDASKVINKSKTGSFFEYLDAEGIKNELVKLYESKGKYNFDSEAIKQYSRESLTQELSDLLEEVSG